MKKTEIICGVRVHNLKILMEFYNPAADGRKTFEIRKNDRGFKVGDAVSLNPWDQKKKRYIKTLPPLICLITYITKYDQKPGNIVMGTTRCLDRTKIPGFFTVKGGI